MRLSDYPFLKYLPFLIMGILIGEYGFFDVFILLGLVLLLYSGFAWQTLRIHSSIGFKSSLGYLIMVAFGLFLGQQESNLKSNPIVNFSGTESYLARVKRFDVPKPNSAENLLELVAIKDSMVWKPGKASILVYHRGDTRLFPGQMVWVKNKPDSIAGPSFPYEFDYKGFLAGKGIHHRQFLDRKMEVISHSEESFFEFLLPKIRQKLLLRIEVNVPNESSKQIAAALLLGEKSSLDREIRESYAATGTMHILAVSGLHVGIIYAILFFPLRYWKLSAGKKKMYLIGVIFVIWCYALLTGFSPSVIRAATMFSFFTLGDMRRRKPSSWNLLGLSATIMLVFDPGAYREVGFQLSYLAVAGILALQPLIVRWWLPKSRVLEYFWQLAAVSIAAQLATFPLSVFYFHLFPVYFLIANLVVIPLSFFAMLAGVGLLLLGWIPGIDVVFGFLVNWIIFAQNWLTEVIRALPGGNLDRLTITIFGMLMVWTLLLAWANWQLGNRKIILSVVILMFSLWTVDRNNREFRKPVEEWILFSSEKGSMLEVRLGKRVLVWNENFPVDQISYGIDPHRIASGIPKIPERLQVVFQENRYFIPYWGVRFSAEDWRFEFPENTSIGINRLGNSMQVDSVSGSIRRF